MTPQLTTPAAPRALIAYPSAGKPGPYCACLACTAARKATTRRLRGSARLRYDGTWADLECPACGGEGVFTFDDWSSAQARGEGGPDEGREECEECGGSGVIDAGACRLCGHLVPTDGGEAPECGSCFDCACGAAVHPDAAFHDWCPACAPAEAAKAGMADMYLQATRPTARAGKNLA